MKRSIAAAFTLCAALAAPDSASAKAGIVKIEINGAALDSPLEITDPAVIREFSIWIGPGVRINDKPAHLDPGNTRGMFIDWPKGIATQHPKALQRYDVRFHLEYTGAPNEVHRTYAVKYEFDPEGEGGYIYLPGPSEHDFRMNVYSIGHGVEGNWFYSTPAWEKLVRPRVEDASCDGHAANASTKRPRRLFGSFI